MTSESKQSPPHWLGGKEAPHYSHFREVQFMEGDLLHISRDRKHGDPFPLPRLHKEFAHADDFNFDLQGLSLRHLQLVNEAVRSANALAGACMKADRSAPEFPAYPSKRLTAVQVSIINDLVARVSTVGQPPEGLREDDALKELCWGFLPL